MEKDMCSSHKKKLIFGSPNNYGFSDAIKSELSLLGYSVTDYSQLNTVFHYPNLFHRVYNFYRKTFFSDTSYKDKLKQFYIGKNLCNELKKIEKVDFSFIIRPDLFPESFIRELSNKSNFTIAYQWDGIQRYPNVINYIAYFDRFLTFENNALLENTASCTNFYLEEIIKDHQYTVHNTAFFLSTFQENRIAETIALKQILDRININTQFIIYCNNKQQLKALKDNSITIIKKPITYYESLKMTLQSRVLIDIHNPVHNGLSFRVFEAVGYEKKLITTNKEVSKYDFYDVRNILIWDNQSAEEIETFCKAPYYKLNPRVKEKYAFKNWFEYYTTH